MDVTDAAHCRGEAEIWPSAGSSPLASALQSRETRWDRSYRFLWRGEARNRPHFRRLRADDAPFPGPTASALWVRAIDEFAATTLRIALATLSSCHAGRPRSERILAAPEAGMRGGTTSRQRGSVASCAVWRSEAAVTASIELCRPARPYPRW